MSNNTFQFKQFTISQEFSGMKVGTDGVLLGSWVDVSNSKNILDIGTGTGLIALMLAQRFESIIYAIEPDKESLKDAKNNFKSSNWQNQINLSNQSLQEFVLNNEIKFDHIVSNPPYFSNSLLPDNESRKLARHNDSLSLKELIEISAELLNPNGKISLILPFSEEKAIDDMALKVGLFPQRKLYIKPTPSKENKRILVELSRKESNIIQETICIETGGRHVYSEEYKELTKDYYLNF